MLGGVGTRPVLAAPTSGNHVKPITHHSQLLNIFFAAIIDEFSGKAM
jgi:hypothetical protein